QYALNLGCFLMLGISFSDVEDIFSASIFEQKMNKRQVTIVR
ncbi:MAG: hypothetical protein ACJAT9_000970, partial [Polaribacter sp.]